MDKTLKKPYITPELELTLFTVEDIITTSSNPTDNDVGDNWGTGEGGWM